MLQQAPARGGLALSDIIPGRAVLNYHTVCGHSPTEVPLQRLSCLP